MFSLNNNCLMHCSSPEIKFVRSPEYSHVSQRVIAVLTDKWGSFDWYPLQNHVLPVLSELHNMVVIGEAKSGKTLSSVIAVVSSVIRQLQLDPFMPKTYGPKAIHLCCYSSDVRDVNEMYTSLLDGPDPDNVVSMACGAMSLEAAKAVIEGCDILITTPPCLVRILESIQKAELTRLRHIVFDDADVIFNVFPNEVETIMEIGLAMWTEREIQMILLSKRWDEKLELFVKNTIHNGVVYVSSMHLHEAMFYSESKINFEFFKPGHKTECLRALLMDIDSYQRTVIFCKSSHEILYLQEELGDIPAISLLVVHDEMSVPEVSEVGKAWTNSLHNPVLLCTDGLVFSELRLTNCTRLIHYSLPTQNDSFSYRFGCLMKSYRNIFLYEEKNKEAPRIDILIDKTNDEPSPMIVNLMNRLKVHPVIDEVEQCIVRRKDISRKHAPVCDLLCKFGVCMEQKNACLHRHIFIKCVDDVDDYEKLLKIPDSGVVKIWIQNVQSANHFTASIIAQKVGEKWVDMPNLQLLKKLIDMKMWAYFSEEKNRCWLLMREVGDIVAVEARPDYLPGLYCRARVISVLSETRVKVKLIDVGDFMEFDVFELFDLPDRLKVYPHLTVDLFLSGLKPPARDCNWLVNADQFSSIWVGRAMTNSRISGKNFIYGEIQMKVNHCLWMTNIKYSGWRGKSSVESSLGFELLSRQLAEPNSVHKTRLTNLMEIAGITEQGAGAATEIGEQRWAELPRDVYSNVEVLAAQNPQYLYLRHKNVADRLDLLNADIQHFAESSAHVKKGTLGLGSICLALSNDIWRRAKIYKISSDLQILEVFFVDEGCSGWVKWDEVREIPHSFAKRLPFQAIECELAGMEEPEGGWNVMLESAIFEISNFHAFRKALQTYVVQEKRPVMGERKYSIILIDTNSSPNIIMNRALPNWGFAERQPQESSIDKIINQFAASSLQEEED